MAWVSKSQVERVKSQLQLTEIPKSQFPLTPFWSIPDDDDNGDGVPDCLEYLLDSDSDADGIPDYVDPDFDWTTVDTDGDGIPNKSDPDDDNDGILDEQEDSDNDGIPDDKGLFPPLPTICLPVSTPPFLTPFPSPSLLFLFLPLPPPSYRNT